MGIARGPNLVKDDLVFGYDSGYGVADNNTATRFYPGEPTVNLLNYDTTMPIWPSNSSNMATLTSKTSARSFTVIGTCNVPGSMTFVYPSITTNTTFHTISATFTNTSTETSDVALYIRGKNNATSTVNQSQTTTIQPGQSIRKTLIGSILTVNGGYTAAVGVWSHGTSGQVNMNVTDIQFEETTHATPFVDGTRSSTQSLVDLKRTTDIDVSNISFDSTGQPEFDGTNDYINIPSSFRSYFTSAPVAVELVLKKSSADQSAMVVFDVDITRWNLNYNLYTSGQWAFDFYDGTEHVISAGNYDNEYVHFVLQQLSNGTMEIYANGILKGTITSSGNLAPNSSGPRIGSRSNGDSRYFKGELPVFKIHSDSLSANQVLQNYNAYKNRFNI